MPHEQICEGRSQWWAEPKAERGGATYVRVAILCLAVSQSFESQIFIHTFPLSRQAKRLYDLPRTHSSQAPTLKEGAGQGKEGRGLGPVLRGMGAAFEVPNLCLEPWSNLESSEGN